MIARKRKILLSVIYLSSMFGCQLPGPVATSDVQRYMLQLEPSASLRRSAMPADPVLRISRPAPGPGMATRRMVYRQVEGQLEYFALHEWADTPSRMLAAVLGEQLYDIGKFRAVLTGSMDVRADFRLDSELLQLVQVFDTTGSWVQFDIGVTLVDLASRSVLFAEHFSYQERAASSDPAAGVKATQRALQRFVEDLSRRLVTLEFVQPDRSEVE